MTNPAPFPAFLPVMGEVFWVSSASRLALKLSLNPPRPQPEALPEPELKANLESSRVSHFSAGADTSNLCVITLIKQGKKLQKASFFTVLPHLFIFLPCIWREVKEILHRDCPGAEWLKISVGLTLPAQAKLVCRACWQGEMQLASL